MKFGLLIYMFCVSTPILADLVTTRAKTDLGGSWFGTIIELSGNKLRLRARFRTGERELMFDRSTLDWIEFNNSTMNDGAPPLSFGVQKRKQNRAPKQRASQEGGDLLILPLGGREHCKGTEIDAFSVKCGRKSFSRSDVVWVVFQP